VSQCVKFFYSFHVHLTGRRRFSGRWELEEVVNEIRKEGTKREVHGKQERTRAEANVARIRVIRSWYWSNHRHRKTSDKSPVLGHNFEPVIKLEKAKALIGSGESIDERSLCGSMARACVSASEPSRFESRFPPTGETIRRLAKQLALIRAGPDGPSKTNRLSMARQSRIQAYDQPRTRRTDFRVGSRYDPHQSKTTWRVVLAGSG